MESEKLEEIEIMGVTEQGSDRVGPLFYNSRLSLYWWHLEKVYFVLQWIAVILNAEEGLSLSSCLISALCEEKDVRWVAASLNQPQVPLVWQSKAGLLLPALAKSPPFLCPQLILTPAHGGNRGWRLCFVSVGECSTGR